MQKKLPSAITGLTLNRATFNDVRADGLTLVNFFYGKNGTGKSSAANAIAENDGVIWAEGKSAADYDLLVFDRDFIDSNFNSYNALAGVFIFGEEDIEAKNKIAALTEKMNAISAEHTALLEEYSIKTAEADKLLNDLRGSCFDKTAELRKRFEKCMDGKKQKKSFFDAILGETAPTEYDLSELERLYDVAFDDNAGTFPEFGKASAATYGSLRGKELLDKVIVSSSGTPFARFIKALGDTASDWVRDGHTHFSGAAAGRCPYCQQKLPEGFENDIAAAFDAQYRQDIRDLGQFRTVYENETAAVLRVLKANTDNVPASLDLSAYREKLALLEKNFEINLRRISEKTKEPSKVVCLEDTDTLLLELGALIDGINKLIAENNAVAASKRSGRSKCKTWIMQYLAFILTEDVKKYHETSERLGSEINEIVSQEKKMKKELAELASGISVLNKRNANTYAAVEGINDILVSSGMQGFSIRAKKNDENVYEIVRKDGSTAKDLSEGERNLIAFLYFAQMVRGSSDSDRIKDKIVVIDDPVSGMDNASLMTVSSIVRGMISSCLANAENTGKKTAYDRIKQMFIFTHNVSFHREITYKQVGNYGKVSFYSVRKADNISSVKLCVRQSREDPSGKENYSPVKDGYSAMWEELGEIRSAVPLMNVMKRILRHYFIGICGYDVISLRSVVLENDASRSKFIISSADGNSDTSALGTAVSMLDIGEEKQGVYNDTGHAEDNDDAEIYRQVFKTIFEVLGHERHYKMMIGGDMNV